jgi:two-component system C4-dicarboxylate transport sensor histidine kinase DctB
MNPEGLVNARGLVQSGHMDNGMRSRVMIVVAFLAVTAAVAGGVWRYGYVQGLDQLAARGEADLALAGDRLVGQLQRYRDLAVLMADHPGVNDALGGRVTSQTRDLLQEVADKTAALDVLVLDAQGQLVASALGKVPRDLSGYPYVKRALRGALGWGHGGVLPLTQRAFFHAAPVFAGASDVQGVVVVVTDLNGIDYNWRGTNPATFFTDSAGEVYISNRSELLFWKRPEGDAGLIPPKGAAAPFAAHMLNGHEVWQMGWGPYLPIEGLHLTQNLPVIGMTGEVLLDVSQTRALAFAQALAVAGLCMAFGSLLFLAAERRRTLTRANAELEKRVSQRTAALRETNTKLRAEAAEREDAQAALRRAQNDLVQAGKLSALGQMSAGISHELNQPLMAIRSFSENAVQFMERGAPERAAENLARISDMARRMGRIIQNLRTFARQENLPPDRVELGAVLQSALDLTETRIAEEGVLLVYTAPVAPIWVRGGEVRLGQVFVNLITNAVDAMHQSTDKRLNIQIVQDGSLGVSFEDSGPGIEMPDKVFDPFYTTKPVGETGGMGLGLSISYGIVQSFGGQIKGVNGANGGALFTVTLERSADKVTAA